MQMAAAPTVAGGPRAPVPRAPGFEEKRVEMGAPAGGAPLLDRVEHEALLLNIDASLQVQARHQFFIWTQGLLQNLVRHEVLLCALHGNESSAFHVESFVSTSAEPSALSDAFCRDTAMVPHLIKTWEDADFHPVSCAVGPNSRFAQSPLARELAKTGVDVVHAHGTYDVHGKPVSFFTFACRAASLRPHTQYFIELIVPFLHLAWTRIGIARPMEIAGRTGTSAALLTTREQEILKWIHLGKSNIEIGLILGISALTVKNHVQHILRKLDVHNRTQAVSKGLALRILSF